MVIRISSNIVFILGHLIKISKTSSQVIAAPNSMIFQMEINDILTINEKHLLLFSF